MREYPGVEILFFLGRDQDQDTHVSHLININVKRGRNFFGYKIKRAAFVAQMLFYIILQQYFCVSI